MAVRAIFLVGFMACGKTTLGQQLAQRLHWDFVDLDAHIEAREQKTIAGIFQERGEPEFRALESRALMELTQSLARDTVVALGGGTFAHASNRELLSSWPTIFLDTPVEELWQRSMENAGQRPLRKERSEFAGLHQKRLPFYRQASVTIVTSGKDPNSLCAEIESTLHSWGQTSPNGPDMERVDIKKSETEHAVAGPPASSANPGHRSEIGETS
ncbi:MAG: shikimate kinase [Terriglobales bacterium]